MNPLKRFLMILTLTSLWSPSFLFYKICLRELPAFTIVSLRVGIAAIVLLAILTLKGTAFPKGKSFWIHSSVMAFFCTTLPFYLYAFSEQYIESAMAAILNGTVPIFTVVLAHLFVSTDRLSLPKILGVSLSFLGLIILFFPAIIANFSKFEDSFTLEEILGLSAGALAAVSYAISLVYAKKFMVKHPPFTAPTAQILLSSCMLIPCAFYFDDPLNIPIPSMLTIFSILSLALLGTVTAFIVYYKLIEHAGPTAVSMVACFFPIGGILLGYLFLGEALDLRSVTAAILILSGVMIVNELITFRFGKKEVIPQPS